MVKYRRIYESTIKRFSAKNVLIGMALVFSMFYMMADRGDITILNYSEDSKCAGTIYEPCYAYLEFKANTDIYIYPTNNTTWAFQTRPETAMNEIIMQRSWGTGWRTIDLSKSWSSKVKYAIKFHNDTTYKLRFVGFKHNINDTVKWGFGFDQGDPDKNTKEYIDPVWEGYNSEDFFAEITDYDAGLTSGYAEFTFMNPLSKDIELNESTFTSLFNVVRGEIISSKYSYDVVSNKKTIKEDKETCIDNFSNITVIEYNNVTEQNESVWREINTPICTIEKVDVIVPAKISKKDMGLVIVPKYEQITLRIDLEYEPNTIVEWIPQIEVDGIKFKGDKL